MPRLARRAAWICAVGAASVVTALAITELLMRTFGLHSPYTTRTDYVPGRHTNTFIDRPGWAWEFTANRNGFRAPDVGPKKDGEIRIVVIGDSHTWGLGVSDEERYSSLLERELRAAGRDATVINIGLNSLTYRHYVQLAEWSGQFQPDIIMVTSYLGNDPAETFLRPWRRVDQHLKPDLREHIWRWLRQSHLYTMAIARFRQLELDRVTSQGEKCGVPPPVHENGGRHSQFLEQHCWYQTVQDRIEDSMTAMSREIPAIAAVSKSHGAKSVLAMLPSPVAVGLDPKGNAALEAAAKHIGVNVEDAVATEVRIEERLGEIARGHFSCVVSLSPVLRAYKPREELYFLRDWHLAPAGQAVVASRLRLAVDKLLDSRNADCAA